MPKFQKGQGGRPKGIPNKATRDIKEMIGKFLDKNYWPTLETRWNSGNVTWPEMQTLLAYRFGKPKEMHEVTGFDGGPLQFSRIEVVLVDGKDAED